MFSIALHMLLRHGKNLLCLGLTIMLLSYAGCKPASLPPAKKTDTDLEKTFVASFNKTTRLDFPVTVSTKIVGKTFWVYVATDKDLVTISSFSSKSGGPTPEKIIKFVDINCHYIESTFSIDYFFLKYDPADNDRQGLFKVIGGSSETLAQDFADSAFEILQKTYACIGDIIGQSKDFNFFAICLANIKKGNKITIISHRVDMEQFLSGMLPLEEFYNRTLLNVDGGKNIVNDRYGLHLNYADISLTDFLKEQIINNANSQLREMQKFTPEKLKGLETLDEVILKSVYEVTAKYQFQDYLLVEIEDLKAKKRWSVSKSALEKKFEKIPKGFFLQDLNL